jgi:hypothetical protein
MDVMSTVAASTSADLNDLLVDLGRSLLQYVGECWPWVPADAARAQADIERLVARQRENVARLTELLIRRNGAIDFGTFPTEYTDLHYVALDYLLELLITAEESLVAEVERARALCDDAEAAALLDDILVDERDIVAELRRLASAK